MTASYELWYASDLGNRLAYINDVMSFEYVKVIGDIGIGIFQFPQRPSPYKANIPDRRIHVYRQPIGGRLRLDFSCRVRRFDTETTRDGQFWRSLQGFDSNELLRRRIIATYASTSGAMLDNAFVDDGMKAKADSWAISDIGSYGFSIQPDASEGPQITKGFAWRNLLSVLQDLQADSKARGNEVFFGLTDTSETTAEFRTWTNQPGRDLTGKIIFSVERGNLSNPRLSYDHSEEINAVHVGGQGQEQSRVVQYVEDADRINVSRLNKAEKFRHSMAKSSSEANEEAYAELEFGRPRVNFSATISDTPQVRYGRDWQVGDKVSVSYAGIQMETIMRSVRVRVEPNGREIVESRVENANITVIA